VYPSIRLSSVCTRLPAWPFYLYLASVPGDLVIYLPISSPLTLLGSWFIWNSSYLLPPVAMDEPSSPMAPWEMGRSLIVGQVNPPSSSRGTFEVNILTTISTIPHTPNIIKPTKTNSTLKLRGRRHIHLSPLNVHWTFRGGGGKARKKLDVSVGNFCKKMFFYFMLKSKRKQR